MSCLGLINQLIQFEYSTVFYQKSLFLHMKGVSYISAHAVTGQPEHPPPNNKTMSSFMRCSSPSLLSHLVFVFRWQQIGPVHQWLFCPHIWRSVGLQLPSRQGDGVPRLQECRILKRMLRDMYLKANSKFCGFVYIEMDSATLSEVRWFIYNQWWMTSEKCIIVF